MESLEQASAQFDERRTALEAKLGEPTDDDELQRLCDELAEIAEEHDAAEAKWTGLQKELEVTE